MHKLYINLKNISDNTSYVLNIEDGDKATELSFDCKNTRSINTSLLKLFDYIIEKNFDQLIIISSLNNIIINGYLLVLASYMNYKIVINEVKQDAFKLSYEFEDIQIYKKLLNKKIVEKDYLSLPGNLKSIYYVTEEGIELSKFGERVIKDAKKNNYR